MLAALVLGPAIALGPATFTEPELAAALTRAGMPTEASPALRDRAAFVLLRDRSPEAVRRLLGEALGVSFEPRPGGGWRMVPAPAVRARDRRFLAAYERVAARTLREWAAGWQEAEAGRGYEAVLTDLRQRSAEYDAAEGTGVRGKPEEAAAYFRTLSLARPTLWNLVHQGAELDRMAASVRGPVDVTIPYAQTGLPGTIADNAARLPVPSTAEIMLHHRFDPAEGIFISEDELIRGDRHDNVRLAYPWAYALGFEQDTRFGAFAERESVEATFAAMGPEAAAYLRAMPRKTELPTTPIPGGVGDLSTALERLGPDALEAVMELTPTFEEVPHERMRALVAPMTLRSMLTSTPYESYYLGADLMFLVGSPGYADLLRRRGERRYPLRAVERDGAILVENPYAFLDRVQWLSPVPYLRLQRLLAKEPDVTREFAGGGVVPTWDLLVRMARTARPESTLGAMAVHPFYRGVGVIQAAMLEPLVAVVEAVPFSERRAMWATLAREGRASVAVPEGRLDLTAGGAPKFLTRNHGGAVFMIQSTLYTPEGSRALGSGLFDGRGTLVP